MSAKRQRRKRRQAKRVLLVEGAPAGAQRREVTIIEAGWGSSGYYSQDVLSRDGAKAWPAGTHMYLDHPSVSEERDRPERSVRDLVGVLASNPVMREGKLTATADVFEHWAPVIDQLAPHIGVSIRAMGGMEEGEAEGRSGPIITSLDEGLSVDYVTHAGAGGTVGPLIEAARSKHDKHFPLHEVTINGKTVEDSDLVVKESKAAEAVKPAQEVTEMTDAEKKQLDELTESVKQLGTKVEETESALKEERSKRERAEDALLRIKAGKVVAEATTTPEGADAPISVFKGLPERAVSRVTEAALAGELPVTEDGKLNESHLRERAVKAAKEEREYLGAAGVGPQVEGMGDSDPLVATTESKADAKKLEESFCRLGLGENAAKIAAGGR